MSFVNRAPPPPGMTTIPTTATTTPLDMAIATIAATAAAAAAVATTAESSPDEDDGECHLLGSFSILIQGALGALALLSLVYKRWRERPQRPVKIWAFDVSKQVVGSIMLHLLNLAMSELSSGAFSVVAAATKGVQGAAEVAAGSRRAYTREMVARELLMAAGSSVLGRAEDGAAAAGGDGAASATKMPTGAQNPCSFYLLNLAIDTTLGIPILIALLRVVTFAAARTPLARPPESIQSGNYGRPPRATWWLKQCLIYFVGLLGMKLCVFGIFQLLPWLGAVGDWALRWTEGNQQLQIFFVMFFFPLVMNAMQYYIIDGFIKDRGHGADDGKDGHTSSDHAAYEQVGQGEDDDDLQIEGEDREEEEEEALVGGTAGRTTGRHTHARRSGNGVTKNVEYDSDDDDVEVAKSTEVGRR